MQLANLLNFLGAHLAEAILLGVTFTSMLFRKSITSYLEGKIKFDFDRKIEELRDQFTQNSQKIDRLQSGAFAALAEHNGLVVSKKMEAYEELWEFLCSLDKWAGVASLHHMLNMNEVRERAKSDDNIRRFCDTILAG